MSLVKERRSSLNLFKRYLRNIATVNHSRLLWTITSYKYFLNIKQTNLFNKSRISILHLFTKKRNFCKIYSYSTPNIFLSPGIILRFLKLHRRRALRKHKRVWIGLIKALKILLYRPVILYFDNLFGMRLSLFERLVKRKFIKIWIFIRLFYLNFTLKSKTRRRIKRWLRKKYYKLGISENK